MSTFKGIVAEFPQVRIDYFRLQPGHKPPLACFLSHVHSDHLAGLESLKAPFVYCSPATREILLRLEKYHYRINFAHKKLESRKVTYGRRMRRLAKPLPLDTPTTIELAPDNSIQVTLIDANHCIGAVMFLIQGGGNAILYTGDIRAESWWVNSLVQNPVLLPYTLGPRRLDCMYLDTTFATKSKPYRKFKSKAEGIRDLLDQVAKYPDDTIFYFHSWTFGYENVWIALSAFLRSRIHVDEYRTRLYASLSNLDKQSLRNMGLNVQSDNKEFLQASGLDVREAPALCGFRNGNRVQPGCLTSQSDVRIHSCELGMGCPVMDHDQDARVVHIIPIVTRAKDTNTEIAELGAGGGKGDLDKKEELETGSAVDVEKIMDICAKSIQDEELLSKVSNLLQKAVKEGRGTIDLDRVLPMEGQDKEVDMSLEKVASILSSHIAKTQEENIPQNRTIRFEYSRHSSYEELRELVQAFKPKDVFPCTVDESRWDPDLSMRSLFGGGELCSGETFRHDVEMMKTYDARIEKELQERREQESQFETQSSGFGSEGPITVKRLKSDHSIPTLDDEGDAAELTYKEVDYTTLTDVALENMYSGDSALERSDVSAEQQENRNASPITSTRDEQAATVVSDSELPSGLNTAPTDAVRPSIADTPRKHKRKRLSNARIAYYAAHGSNGLTWADMGGLVSARMEHEEEEL